MVAFGTVGTLGISEGVLFFLSVRWASLEQRLIDRLLDWMGLGRFEGFPCEGFLAWQSMGHWCHGFGLLD